MRAVWPIEFLYLPTLKKSGFQSFFSFLVFYPLYLSSYPFSSFSCSVRRRRRRMRRRKRRRRRMRRRRRRRRRRRGKKTPALFGPAVGHTTRGTFLDSPPSSTRGTFLASPSLPSPPPPRPPPRPAEVRRTVGGRDLCKEMR